MMLFIAKNLFFLTGKFLVFRRILFEKRGRADDRNYALFDFPAEFLATQRAIHSP